MKHTNTIAVAEAMLAITLWAMSFILIKIALRELSAVALITLRFTVASVFVVPVLWMTGGLASLRVRDVPRMAVLGAVGVTLHQLLQVAGQQTTSAGMAALCAATATAFMFILAAMFLGERLGIRQIGGVCLALAGAGIVTAGAADWSAVAGGRSVVTGNMLVLLSAVVWAAAGVMGKRMMRKRPSVVVTAGMLVFGWLFTIPFFVAEGSWVQITRLSPTVWGSVIALGVLCTAVAHLANNHALKTISAQRVALIQNLEPFLAVLGAWLILGERMSWLSALGGVAIVAGVFVTEKHAAADHPRVSRVSRPG